MHFLWDFTNFYRQEHLSRCDSKGLKQNRFRGRVSQAENHWFRGRAKIHHSPCVQILGPFFENSIQELHLRCQQLLRSNLNWSRNLDRTPTKSPRPSLNRLRHPSVRGPRGSRSPRIASRPGPLEARRPCCFLGSKSTRLMALPGLPLERHDFGQGCMLFFVSQAWIGGVWGFVHSLVHFHRNVGLFWKHGSSSGVRE